MIPRARVRVVAAGALVGLAGAVVFGLGASSAADASAGPSVTGLYLDGEPNEWIANGNQLAFVAPGSTMTLGLPSPDHTFVSFGVDEGWGVSIDAPAGETLMAGMTFPAVNGIAPPGTGLLNVGGDGRGCTLADGFVKVLESEFDNGGNATSFAADFWLRCDDGRNARMYGSVRYQSSVGLRAVTVDPDAVDFGDAIVGTPSATHDVTIVNHGNEAVQFATPELDGPGAAAFVIQGSTCSVLTAGSSCVVSVRVEASTRGGKQADLVIPDSTVRGERRIALTAAAWQTTTMTLEVADMHPDDGFGPDLLVTVSPNPGKQYVSFRWTGGGGEGDPGLTGTTLDPATGSAHTGPLGIGSGTWTITATFARQDAFEASTAKIVDLVVPQGTKLLLNSNSPSMPGSPALLHAMMYTVFGEPLVAGTITIRDETDTVVATGPVGGAVKTLDAEVCCPALGEHLFTATYEPDTPAAFAASDTRQHVVEVPAPYGYIYVGLSKLTASPVIPIHAEAYVAMGTITRMRVSNDGVHWIERAPAADFTWDLTNATAGGSPDDGLHFVYVQWATDDSAWSTGAAGSIELDRTAPATTTVTTAMVPSAITTNGAGTVELAWSATDGVGSGVDHYVVARSTDGRPYVTIDAADPWTSRTQSIPPGHAYRFRVAGVDHAGNVGAWAYGPSFRLTAVSQSATAVHYAGRWSTVSGTTWWGGTARSSTVKGSTVSFTFTGRSIAWVGLRGPNRGRAAVYVNGVLVSTVDLSFSQTRQQLTVWAANFTTSAKRTVTIKVLGTAGRPRVDVDGFIVRT